MHFKNNPLSSITEIQPCVWQSPPPQPPYKLFLEMISHNFQSYLFLSLDTCRNHIFCMITCFNNHHADQVWLTPQWSTRRTVVNSELHWGMCAENKLLHMNDIFMMKSFIRFFFFFKGSKVDKKIIVKSNVTALICVTCTYVEALIL